MRNFSWLLAEGDVTLEVGLERDLVLVLKTGRGEQAGMQAASRSWSIGENSSLRTCKKEHSLDDTLIF